MDTKTCSSHAATEMPLSTSPILEAVPSEAGKSSRATPTTCGLFGPLTSTSMGTSTFLGASHNDNKISWYENLGDGEFGHQQTFSIGEVVDQEGNYGKIIPIPQCGGAYDANLDGTVEVFGGGSYSLDMWGTLPIGEVGCTDSEACNYDATAEFDYGCNYECYGCTQPTAINYDPDAIEDDLSCLTPLDGCANIAGQYEYLLGNNVDTDYHPLSR